MLAKILFWIVGDLFKSLVMAGVGLVDAFTAVVEAVVRLVEALRKLWHALTDWVTPVWVDGTLYISIALFAYLQSFLSNDDVFKYVNAFELFYLKALTGGLAAVTGALKMYRSNTYAEHRIAKTGNTEFFTKTP